MDKNIDIPLLLDLYGNMLSKVQRDNLDLYYNKDLSLSEISDNIGKSRQGVFESIKKAEEILYSAEQKLKFLEKFTQIRNDFSEIENILNVQNFDKAKILKITQKYKLD